MHNNMISSKSKKIWWSKLKAAFSSKKGYISRRKEAKEGSLCQKLNVNDEYKGVMRTKSYMDIRSKVHDVHLTESQTTTALDDDDDDDDEEEHYSSSPPPSPSSSCSSSSSSPSSSSSSSPLPFYMNLSDVLLEPRQEAVIDIIKSSNLQTLLIDYFDASLEACNICELLLRGIHKTQSNHRLIKRVIDLYEGGRGGEEEERCPSNNNNINNEKCHEMMLQDLTSFANLNNSLSGIINGEVNFSTIHDKYANLLRKLTSRRRKTKRKEKFTRLYKKAAGYGFVITYIVLAVALLALATHSVVGLLGAPGLLLPFSMDIINKVVKGGGGFRSLKANFLRHLGAQLDVAAKGIYIFINDFDTVGRLVTRLHDEVDRKREIAEMCVRNGRNHEVIKEAIKDIRMHEQGFQEQLEELEEHIYLCFLTINRSRRLVLEQILAPLNNP